MPASTHHNGGGQHAGVDVVALCLKYIGVAPTLETHYDRTQVRLLDRVQSRIDSNNAPTEMVNRYAHQMQESPFPPPLYTADHVPVDGNTRTKAYMKNGVRYIEAWILPVTAIGADRLTTDKLLQLSYALNATNGKPLDVDELIKFAESLIRANHNDEDIVGNTGLALSKVTMLRAQLRASERITNLGIDVEGLQFADTVLRAFGKPNAMRLDDDDYRGLLDLTNDARLKAGQVNDLAGSLNQATSSEARQERLGRERQALEPQIRAIRTGQLHPMQTAKLRKAMELVSTHPITAFVESDPAEAIDYLDNLDKMIAKLGEIRALQAAQPAATAAHEATEAVH